MKKKKKNIDDLTNELFSEMIGEYNEEDYKKKKEKKE